MSSKSLFFVAMVNLAVAIAAAIRGDEQGLKFLTIIMTIWLVGGIIVEKIEDFREVEK